MPQNQQKKSWDYTFKKVLLVFKVLSRAVFDRFWPLFGIFGHISIEGHRIFYFYCITINFIYMCLRINNKNLGTRPLKRCYWFSKYQVERFLVIFEHWFDTMFIFFSLSLSEKKVFGYFLISTYRNHYCCLYFHFSAILIQLCSLTLFADKKKYGPAANDAS